MRITSVTAMTIKASTMYSVGGQSRPGGTLPGGDYLRIHPYPGLYGSRTESMITRIETDSGLIGWGESQAPVAPEVTQTIVSRVLAPLVLGRDPLDHRVLALEMADSLRDRGHSGGFQQDAIAAVDTALWDLAARALQVPVSTLLGGRLRDSLPCYVSGLRAESLQLRATEAKAAFDQGFVAVKSFLGNGVRADTTELEELRRVVGDGDLYVDALWRYTPAEALRLGRSLDNLGVALFEAPIAPENRAGHAALAQALDVPIAGGEALRTARTFLPWLLDGALDVVQPDLMRNGITESARIADLAELHQVPVAMHNGVVTPIGMAATWQLAATLPNTFPQEYGPRMAGIFAGWLRTPLRVQDGQALVPDGPGLGIEIDEDRLRQDVADATTVAL